MSLHTQTAASQMIKHVPVVSPDWTLQKAKEYFIKNVSSFESIRYLYVVDDANRFEGVLSLKDIFRHSAEAKVSSISHKKSLIFVKPSTNQGRVVYLALKHNIKAIPVVGEDFTFLGVVPSDKILEIVYKEAKGSVLRFAGISDIHAATFKSVEKTPIWVSFRHRIPWLLLGTLGGFLSAQIIGGFEATLQQNLVLAAFIPLIVYISDAVGTQMEAYIIRELVLEEGFSFFKFFFKQLITTWMIGAVCAGLLFVGTLFYYSSFSFAVVLGGSLFLAVSSAVLPGMVIPYLLYRLKVDPASASGPIATIIQDIVSILIYFSVASFVL